MPHCPLGESSQVPRGPGLSTERFLLRSSLTSGPSGCRCCLRPPGHLTHGFGCFSSRIRDERKTKCQRPPLFGRSQQAVLASHRLAVPPPPVWGQGRTQHLATLFGLAGFCPLFGSPLQSWRLSGCFRSCGADLHPALCFVMKTPVFSRGCLSLETPLTAKNKN